MDFPLNPEGLPYPDPMHPIVVHFVIAMVLFAFVCDVIGLLTHNPRFFEVSWWNWFVASLAVFVAIPFGQFEAGLASTYDAVKPVLTKHTIMGWSLSAIIVLMTAWRAGIRGTNFRQLPLTYVSLSALLVCIVCFQVYLGSRLVWVYGLHVKPVVEAVQQGVLGS